MIEKRREPSDLLRALLAVCASALVSCGEGAVVVDDETTRGAFYRAPADGGTPRDLRPDLASCTTCICAFGPCCRDSDCSSTSGAKCVAGQCKKNGKVVDSDDKRDCQRWMAAQKGCDKKSVVPRAPTYDPLGCRNVRLELKGHSSAEECCPYIDTVFQLCKVGCNVIANNDGCETFTNQDYAQARFDAWRRLLDAAGVHYHVSISGNQALASCTRMSKMTLSCTGTTYQPCDNGRCYWHGEHRRCTKASSPPQVVNQTCCATGTGDPQWTTGDSCPIKPCSELAGGTCWGGTEKPKCRKANGSVTTLKCCKGNKEAKWVEEGKWGNC